MFQGGIFLLGGQFSLVSFPVSLLLPTSVLLLADREIHMAESAYTWPTDPFNHEEGFWELGGDFLGWQRSYLGQRAQGDGLVTVPSS